MGATSLKRELQGISPRGLVSGSRQCSDLSTSQSQPEIGEQRHWSGSETGGELSVRITGIFDTPPQCQVHKVHSACLTADASCISSSVSIMQQQQQQLWCQGQRVICTNSR